MSFLRRFFQRLVHEIGQAWCETFHLAPRRYFVHQRLGVVSLCLTCRRLHT